MHGTYEECSAYVSKWRAICPQTRYRIDILIFEADGNHTYCVHEESW
jgi:hypothetical protein